MARRNLARPGEAWGGLARLGEAWRGMRSLERLDKVEFLDFPLFFNEERRISQKDFFKDFFRLF